MIVLKVRLLKGFFEKSIGLLRFEKANPIYFTTRFGIHTFFLKFPIDILVMDTNYTVVKQFEKLAPNRIFFWHPRFENIVELPAGEIKKQNIKLGEKMTLEIVTD